uniref:hypothetical protein n=1 Tax=Eisenbergiella tayi TaxID=1432052 RepID=UPI002A7FB0CE
VSTAAFWAERECALKGTLTRTRRLPGRERHAAVIPKPEKEPSPLSVLHFFFAFSYSIGYTFIWSVKS